MAVCRDCGSFYNPEENEEGPRLVGVYPLGTTQKVGDVVETLSQCDSKNCPFRIGFNFEGFHVNTVVVHGNQASDINPN